jgi:hypothetical protein
MAGITGLALAELEAAPGAPLAVLFPFHHTRVPGKETVAPQGNNITRIYLTKRPGNTMPASAGLTIGTAAVHIDEHIKFIFAGSYHEGLANYHGMFALREILD